MESDVLENLAVVKRSGQRVSFNGAKIAVAVKFAFDSVYEQYDEKNVNQVYKEVLDMIRRDYLGRKTINVEDIQDIIEKTLQEKSFLDVYCAFNEYRLRRAASREVFSMKQQHKFVKAIERVGLTVRNSSDDKPIDLMYKFSKTIATEFTKAYLLESKYVRAEEEGLIGVDCLENYALATTSSAHIDFRGLKVDFLNRYTDALLDKMFHYKEEQYGEETLASLDELYEPVLLYEFQTIYERILKQYFVLEEIYDFVDFTKIQKEIQNLKTIEHPLFIENYSKNRKLNYLFQMAYQVAYEIVKETLQDNLEKLLERFEHLKTKMNHQGISISLGLSFTYEGLLIQTLYFQVLEKMEPLEHVLTIFKICQHSNLEVVSELIQKGKNITCFFVDEKKNIIEQEIFSNGYFLYHNINNDIETSKGRILISSSTVNLARLGFQCVHNIQDFYNELENLMELCKNQLLQRFEIQANKYKENYDYLFRDDVLFDSKKLEMGQKIRKVLRSGVLLIRYVGLNECICALKQKKMLDQNDMEFGFQILQFMEKNIQKFTIDNKLNFGLCEADDERLSKRILGIDKSVLGNPELLKKKSYKPFFQASDTSKYDMETWLDFLSKYQSVSGMIGFVTVSKNYSAKKILQIINLAQKKKIRYLKVQVGKDVN
ncbi:MAG: hypothetical protein HFH86_03055 [Bacilli bacterium]|jgi:anaerobic ribonucleoside-triphosphate reductase|nr:hypothetical protein [Bacilli bacterium]